MALFRDIWKRKIQSFNSINLSWCTNLLFITLIGRRLPLKKPHLHIVAVKVFILLDIVILCKLVPLTAWLCQRKCYVVVYTRMECELSMSSS